MASIWVVGQKHEQLGKVALLSAHQKAADE
jgi:hypothetical protein